jgi:hypothetical protein
MPTEVLRLEDVIVDDDIQPREQGLNLAVVEDYEECYRQGVPMPRPVAFRDAEGRCRLASGFHRYEAANRAGRTELEFEVRSGGFTEAVLFAASSNIGHGLPRTTADKQRAVRLVLGVHREWSDRQIAIHCQVSDPTVGRVRALLAAEEEAAGITNAKMSHSSPPDGQHSPTPGPKSRREEQGREVVRAIRANPGADDQAVARRVGCGQGLVATIRNNVPIDAVPQPTVPAPPDADRDLLDTRGRAIPDHLRDAFTTQWLEQKIAKAEELATEVKKLRAEVRLQAATYGVNMEGWEIDDGCAVAAIRLDCVRDLLRCSWPHTLCTSCGGSRCGVCGQTGWLSQGRFGELLDAVRHTMVPIGPTVEDLRAVVRPASSATDLREAMDGCRRGDGLDDLTT